MRASLLLALVLVAGCVGPGGPVRGGWSVFEGGISCRDCERLVFSNDHGQFEIERTFDIGAGQRLFGWYETPIEPGTRLVVTWTARDIPDIETRRANGDEWITDAQACVADPVATEPTPTTPSPSRGAVGPMRRCVWDHTPDVRLEAPRNGIAIIWEIENVGGNDTVVFSARYG